MKNLSILKRGGVFLLAAIMVIAYMPRFGTGPVYASDDEYTECKEVVDVLTAEQKQAEKDKAEAKVLAEMGVTPRSQTLPPRAVRYVVDDYCIDIPEEMK